MPSVLIIDDFLNNIKGNNQLLLDVRSEGEFLHGHIPGAINLPLLNNAERATVGTIYVKEGRQPAIRKGFELAGPKFASFIDSANELKCSHEIYIYCWRGGLRSHIMAWILELAGFKVSLLKSGYKTFRKWALNHLQTDKQAVVIGGKTGTGKSELLGALLQQGQTVVDLEGLAHHRGSAFGGLGQLPQPTQEQFENDLAWHWGDIAADTVVWLENESRLIGHVRIPDAVYNIIRSAPVVEVQRHFDNRLLRIVNEYGQFDPDILAEKTKKVAKRLGGLRLKQALDFLDNKDISGWAAIMLQYYDGTYSFSNEQRVNPVMVLYDFDEAASVAENAKNILELVKKDLHNKDFIK